MPWIAVRAIIPGMAPADGPDPDADPFRPPAVPTEVHCLHCGREYQSYMIEWVESSEDGNVEGFWCCPTEGCDGKGFGFDILPTDPDYGGEEGRSSWIPDDEEDEYDEPDDVGALDELVDLSELEEIAVFRNEGLDRPIAFKVDIKTALRTGVALTNVKLKPGDIIYVH